MESIELKISFISFHFYLPNKQTNKQRASIWFDKLELYEQHTKEMNDIKLFILNTTRFPS